MELLAKSSLNINLLPLTETDKHMASLLRLQAAKTIAEREKEKITDIMNRPALPSSTITSFGGTKREKQLSAKLTKNALGIVRKNTSNTTLNAKQSNNTSPDKFDYCPNPKKIKLDNSDLNILNSSISDEIQSKIQNDTTIDNNKLIKNKNSIALVSHDYLTSSSESDTES